MFDLAAMAKLYGLADFGLEDPRIPTIVEATIKRYIELSEDGLDQLGVDVVVELATMHVSTKFLAELQAAGMKATDLTDDQMTALVEQATNVAMIRHFDAKRRVFPTRLGIGKNAARHDTRVFLNKLPEARRTGANEERHMARVAQAARIVADEIITFPLTPETMFAIEDILIEEVVYEAGRKSMAFMEVGDAELIKLTEVARDRKSAKIKRLISSS